MFFCTNEKKKRNFARYYHFNEKKKPFINCIKKIISRRL